MNQLIQLAYYSGVTETASNAEFMVRLRAIMEVARRFNAANGITGCLIFDKQWFVQVLEGPVETVKSRYAAIAKDPRHIRPTVIGERNIVRRDFGDWSMQAVLVSVEAHEILLHHGLTLPIDPKRFTLATTVAVCAELARLQGSAAAAA
jgi:hypothetical protein